MGVLSSKKRGAMKQREGEREDRERCRAARKREVTTATNEEKKRRKKYLMSREEEEESDWETAADKEEDEWEKSVSQIAFGGLAVREDVEDEV